MEVPFAFVADSANYSQEGKINALGIFNQISAVKFPTVHPSMALVVRLEASPAEYGQTKHIEIRIMDADGKHLGSLDADLEIPPQEGGRRVTLDHILNLKMFQFPYPGSYSFTILISGEPKKEVTLDLMHVPDEGSGQDG
ncbi:MAG: hypothetical protein HYS09_03865 [Chloroflexi bacterium]|nr:hypothetical protein [Chloroflexota bacterium]